MSRKKRWLLIGVGFALVGAGSQRLTARWLKRERVSCDFDWYWDAQRPLKDNLADLFYIDWGGYFSITEHPDPDQPGYVGITYRQWVVGPFMVRHVVYQRPGTDYD